MAAWEGRLGAGTEADPYLIESEQDFKDYWAEGATNFVRLIRNLDMSSVGTLSPVFDAGGKRIDGAGFRVSNVSFVAEPLGTARNYGSHVIKNIEFEIVTGWTGSMYYSDTSVFENVLFNFLHNEPFSFNTHYKNTNNWVNVVFMGGITFESPALGQRNTQIVNVYILSAISQAAIDTGRFNVVAPDDQLLASSYPDLPTDFWQIEDGMTPFPKAQANDYSTYTHVKGTTLVDGVGESRGVRIMHAYYGNTVAYAKSAEDGTFDIKTRPYTEPLLVISHDDMGTRLKAATAYALGAITYPAAFNGYRYVCIQAGTTADPLPDQPWPTGQLTSGDAIFEAKKVRQPIIHGPVLPVPYLEQD